MTDRTKLLQDLEEILIKAEITDWVGGSALKDPRGLAQSILELVEADKPKAKAPTDRQRARLEKKLTTADLRLQDAESWLSTWSFGMSPSEIHRRKEEIVKLTAARDALKEKLA